MDIDLDWYPELKKDLINVFDMKVSLVDLARLLEKDLVIYEHEPTRFKLDFKSCFDTFVHGQYKLGICNSRFQNFRF